jgi:5-formyltetrahydrofolate cyclo-ligase
VRRLALEQGKVVYMAVPRLSEEKCFLELDPKKLRGVEDQASSIKGAFRYGRPVAPEEIPGTKTDVSYALLADHQRNFSSNGTTCHIHLRD